MCKVVLKWNGGMVCGLVIGVVCELLEHTFTLGTSTYTAKRVAFCFYRNGDKDETILFNYCLFSFLYIR